MFPITALTRGFAGFCLIQKDGNIVPITVFEIYDANIANYTHSSIITRERSVCCLLGYAHDIGIFVTERSVITGFWDLRYKANKVHPYFNNHKEKTILPFCSVMSVTSTYLQLSDQSLSRVIQILKRHSKMGLTEKIDSFMHSSLVAKRKQRNCIFK